VTALEQADGARGARVEIAVRAAQNGDFATAAGILAGFSLEEREAFTPWVTAAAQRRSRDERAGGRDRFGAAALIRIDKSSASRDDDGEPPLPPWLAEHP
jgi:hypothetical protein